MNYFKRGGPSSGFRIFIIVSAILVVTCTAKLNAGPTAGVIDEHTIALSASCRTLATMAEFIDQVPGHTSDLEVQKHLDGYSGLVVYYAARAIGRVQGIISERNMPGLTYGQKVKHIAAEIYERDCAAKVIGSGYESLE